MRIYNEFLIYKGNYVHSPFTARPARESLLTNLTGTSLAILVRRRQDKVAQGVQRVRVPVHATRGILRLG